MADETLIIVKPPIKVTDNGDGTWSISIEDVNSDAILAGILALRNTATLDDIETAVEALIPYLPLDTISLARKTVLEAHSHIHIGDSYTAEHNAVGASGTKATLTFTTPDTTKRIHFLVTMRGNVESFYTLGEGVTVTGSSGSDYAPRNRERNSSSISVLISAGSAGGVGYVTLGAAVTNFGTVLETLHFGSGKQGGESRDIREWVLKQNTTYALEVESQAANSEITIEGHWYER